MNFHHRWGAHVCTPQRLRLVVDNRPLPEVYVRRQAVKRGLLVGVVFVLSLIVLVGISIGASMALDWIGSVP